jgi:hypothetical protein
VHRDVKPSNILIARDGTVKLADFGLAKHLTDEHSHYALGSLTQTRDTFGTPYYIAPEALRGRADSTAAADVYAAGVLLYHLLTGTPPLGNYTPLSQSAGLPRSADAALANALQADPSKRSTDLSALVRCAESAQRGDSLRRGKTVAIAVSSAFLLTAAAWTAGWLAGRPSPAKPPPVFPDPAKAQADAPWTNSLGMKFVPAGGKALLFSVWETRRRDYERFMEADRSVIPEWRLSTPTLKRRTTRMQVLTPSGWEERDGSATEPGFPQTPDDPVVGVAQMDAEMFCVWLTMFERREGRIAANHRYRIPTVLEWLAAADGSTAVGNFAGEEARIEPWPGEWPVLAQRDSFSRTAPVGSFAPQPNGLCDMLGNVSEWTSTETGANRPRPRGGIFYGICGSSWSSGSTEELALSHKRMALRLKAVADTGFRCVLDLAPESREETDP